jgi:hypothetical protein
MEITLYDFNEDFARKDYFKKNKNLFFNIKRLLAIFNTSTVIKNYVIQLTQ